MADIVTLTVNPSIDASTSVEQVVPFHKLRCSSARRDPGGGGINVARVMKRFGADVLRDVCNGRNAWPVAAASSRSGGIPGLPVPISEETREDFTVLEEASGRQYRFVLPGPLLSEQEWRNYLETFASHATRDQTNALRGCQWEPPSWRSERLLWPNRSGDEASRRKADCRYLRTSL